MSCVPQTCDSSRKQARLDCSISYNAKTDLKVQVLYLYKAFDPKVELLY